MIHAKMTKPRIFPWNSARQPEQINRLQEISGDLALNRDKIYEIGRLNLLGYRYRLPTFTGRFRQFEYGSMAFWYDLANMVNPGSGDSHSITLDDLQTKEYDIAAFLTDDSSVFSGTVWFPKLRMTGFTLNIGDPDAMIERNLNLIGEQAIDLPGGYLAYATETSPIHSGDADLDIVLDGTSGRPPVPIAYASGKYIFRVLRIRTGVVSELVEDEGSAPADNTYSYNNSTKTVTVTACETADVVKVYYESATAYTTTWTDDTSDPNVLLAEYAVINLKVGSSSRIYKLQSVGMDVTFERTDYKEIGTHEIVQTGVKSTTVRISLNRFLEGFTLEDILAADTAYPYINPEDYAQNIQMQVLIYGEKEHTNFKIGYLVNNISPTAQGKSQTIQDYLKATTTLESDNVKISDDISELAFA
jgi:hypothetical protein